MTCNPDYDPKVTIYSPRGGDLMRKTNLMTWSKFGVRGHFEERRNLAVDPMKWQDEDEKFWMWNNEFRKAFRSLTKPRILSIDSRLSRLRQDGAGMLAIVQWSYTKSTSRSLAPPYTISLKWTEYISELTSWLQAVDFLAEPVELWTRFPALSVWFPPKGTWLRFHYESRLELNI